VIRLQFCTEGGAVHWGIRQFTRAWCSHVDVVMPDGSLLGAHNIGGVQIRPADYAKFTKVLRVDLPASDEVTEAFYAFVTAQVGKPYDRTAIAAFVTRRDWQSDDAWFCSELVLAGLVAAAFFKFRLSIPANFCDPADLLLLCSVFADIWEQAA
jgi:hypothetical protein